ncbi:uncharacterized protein LOC115631786 [Scaptodrosophila lebanonensis]|uniref:Uncharacterized protein LOC115631786 n=1 Tax=Drosophila lebanonensis TaxID=7225 RepID=A0A6J2U7I4_DROLE|nr:uncharacterized protein LOC115631786 [Scaptodrosophila lebanonensis]XP_030384481.1 uncharacterized protein LOC115631786 [Scaptodrosophila lebanonensis]XP_030384482.1 uncharacterized protein LOC115631786 [Scaptodrosophila lebanonensis]
MASRFSRLLKPGAVMGRELKEHIATYEGHSREKGELDNEIRLLRKQQDETEDNLAEALAEDEFQRILRGQQECAPTDNELVEIFKRHLGRIIDKIAAKYQRSVYLDADMRKLKAVIDKGIAETNSEAGAAAATSV